MEEWEKVRNQINRIWDNDVERNVKGKIDGKIVKM